MTREEMEYMVAQIKGTARKMMENIEQMSDKELKSTIGAGPYKGWTMDAFFTDVLMRMQDERLFDGQMRR